MRILRRVPRGCVLALLGAAALAAPLACSASHSGSTGAGSTSPATSAVSRIAVTAAHTSWQLRAPISRLAAIPQPGGALLAGGLDGSNASSSGVFHLDLTTGQLRSLGSVPQPFHDAAAVIIGQRAEIFGGGAATTTNTVQSFPVHGHGSGRIVGHLPQPRSDLAAATVAGRTYIIGGYTGTTPTPDILSTTDGATFATVTRLPVPVRYPAVTALGTDIYVFGGEHGAADRPVATIQRIDTTTGRATVLGALPVPVAEATAVTVDGRILLAGGRDATGTPLRAVDEINPTDGSVRRVAELDQAVADAPTVVHGSTAYLIGGERARPVAGVQTLTVRQVPVGPAPSTPGTPAATPTTTTGPVSDQHPFNGSLLIADRGNNRLLVVNADKQILWRFPNSAAPAPPTGFYFPDDAFFIHHGAGIISNQEGNDTIVEVGYPSGAPLWSYGHPKVAKPKPGYLHEPDDAYLLSDGKVAVADANNCRVVLVSPKAHQVGQIGTTGACVHNPPHSLGYPNGDTPLADGNLLISEVYGSWVSEYTLSGRLVWTVQLPAVTYPSDPQQIGPDRYLVADYAKPGGLFEFNRAGRILWRYTPRHGPGMLNHPSLAEVLPGGLICTNDDYRNRVVIIDPATKRIVWQYGHTDHKGTRPGYLHIPDGFDLLEPDGTTPTHPFTG